MVAGISFALLLSAAPQDLLNSGRRALESGDLTYAERDFRTYLEAHPPSAQGLSNLKAICARRQQFREAKAEFAEVRRLAAVIERDRQRVESDALMKP